MLLFALSAKDTFNIITGKSIRLFRCLNRTGTDLESKPLPVALNEQFCIPNWLVEKIICFLLKVKPGNHKSIQKKVLSQVAKKLNFTLCRGVEGHQEAVECLRHTLGRNVEKHPGWNLRLLEI